MFSVNVGRCTGTVTTVVETISSLEPFTRKALLPQRGVCSFLGIIMK